MSPHLQGFLLGIVLTAVAVFGGIFIGKAAAQLKADMLQEIRTICTTVK